MSLVCPTDFNSYDFKQNNFDLHVYKYFISHLPLSRGTRVLPFHRYFLADHCYTYIHSVCLLHYVFIINMKHNHFYRSKQKLRESFIIFLNIRYVHILAQTLFFFWGGGRFLLGREKGVTTKWHFQGVNLLYNLLPEVGGWPGINAIVRFKFFFNYSMSS